MESKRGRNHPLSQMAEWIDTYLPEAWKLKGIQVAGTNGKGSLVQWLRVLLAQKGLKTAEFTSPHLIDHQERIAVENRPIQEADWERIFDRWEPFFREKQMTMFEMDFWMALVYFLEEKPDWILMETGMGGEKDAVTTLHYQAQVITNVGLDHMAYLGNTVEEIALAKAGVMETGKPLILSKMDPAALKVLEAEAQKKQAVAIKVKEEDLQVLSFLEKSNLPEYQKENFAAAKRTLEELGFSFSEEEIRRAVNEFSWSGRWSILNDDPLIVLDGAHNLPGIEALVKEAKKHDFKQIYVSMLEDKQAHEMIARLKTLQAPITLVHFDSYRLADLRKLSQAEKLPVISLEELMKSVKNTQQDTLICGSLYFAGDVLKSWNKQKAADREAVVAGRKDL